MSQSKPRYEKEAQKYAARKHAESMRKRTEDDILNHIRYHKFPGLKRKVARAPVCMQINPTTPPAVAVMWTYLCVTSLTIAWFSCSLFGYTLCRLWKNVPAPGEGANLEFIFTAQPLNRWAVNLVVSFGMLLFFTSQSLFFIWRRAIENRNRQKESADEQGWIDREKKLEEEEPGLESDKQPGENLSKTTEADPVAKAKLKQERKARETRDAEDAKQAKIIAAGQTASSVPILSSHQEPIHKFSTHLAPASHPVTPPAIHNNPPIGPSITSATKLSETPMDAAQTEPRSRNGQSSSKSGRNESLRAPESGPSEPPITTTSTGRSDRPKEEARPSKDTRSQDRHTSKTQERPPLPLDTIAQHPPENPARNNQAKEESASSTKSKASKTSSIDQGTLTQPDDPGRNIATPLASSSKHKVGQKHSSNPDTSPDPPNDSSPKDTRHSKRTTSSKTPDPDPESTSVTPKAPNPTPAVKVIDPSSNNNPNTNNINTLPPVSKSTNSLTSEDEPIGTPHHRTMQPVKSSLKQPSSDSHSGPRSHSRSQSKIRFSREV